MLLERLERFAKKPSAEERTTPRFLTQKTLARLPFLPVHVRIQLPPKEEVRYWWSYIPMSFHADRSLLDYWGDDIGEVRFVWQFLQPGMTVLDIGAHHGFYSMLAAKRMENKGLIVAFEPSTRERKRFDLHMRWNGAQGVLLEPYAVSSASGALKFYCVDTAYTMMNSLKKPRLEGPVHEDSVEAVSLDEYIENRGIQKIDFIKIDVEGGELEAFRGAQGVLDKIRPIVMCEVLDYVTEAWGYPARTKVTFLKERGYEWFDFGKNGELFEHEERESYSEPKNYLAVPREKLDLIARWQSA